MLTFVMHLSEFQVADFQMFYSYNMTPWSQQLFLFTHVRMSVCKRVCVRVRACVRVRHGAIVPQKKVKIYSVLWHCIIKH